MYLHVFLFKWNPEVTEAQKQRVHTEVHALQGKIPGLLETYLGANESPRSQGNSFGGVMKFESRAAYQAYVPHPAHTGLVCWLMPLIQPTELDFEA